MNRRPEAVFNALLDDVYRTPEPAPLPPGMIRLDRNEQVGFHTQDVARQILERLTPRLLSQYPDTTELYCTLAAATMLPASNLLLVPGSDAAFRSLAHVFVQLGDRVAMLDPSYQMYPIYVRMFGGTPVSIPVGDDLNGDVDDIVRTALSCKMLWLANPTQPTGMLIPMDRVRQICDILAPAGVVVVIDEAYYPFSAATMIDEVASRANLVVVRTFSKAYGLAGVRLGFAAAPEPIVRTLFKVRSSFDINALAIVAAEWMLDHPELVRACVDEAAQSALILRELAARYDLFAPPSATNFQLIKVAPRFDSGEIKQACWREGYAISGPVGAGRFADYIRVTTGSVEVIRRFAETLEHVFSAALTEVRG